MIKLLPNKIRNLFPKKHSKYDINKQVEQIANEHSFSLLIDKDILVKRKQESDPKCIHTYRVCNLSPNGKFARIIDRDFNDDVYYVEIAQYEIVDVLD